MKKISLRKINNLFQRKDKKYLPEIKYSGDIDSQITSVYNNNCLSSAYMCIQYNHKDTKTDNDIKTIPFSQYDFDILWEKSAGDICYLIIHGLISSFFNLITLIDNPDFENNKILNCIYNEFNMYSDIEDFTFDNEYTMKTFDRIDNVLELRMNDNLQPISMIALETIGDDKIEDMFGDKQVLKYSYMDFIVPEEIFSELFRGEALYFIDYDLENGEKCYFCKMSTLSFLTVLNKKYSYANKSGLLESIQKIINNHDYFEFTENKDYSNFGYILKTLGLSLELSEQDYDSNNDLYKEVDEIID